jgi:hypothetical protein
VVSSPLVPHLQNVTENVSHYTSGSKDGPFGRYFADWAFPVANIPSEILDLCVRVTISELVPLEYSQGLVN